MHRLVCRGDTLGVRALEVPACLHCIQRLPVLSSLHALDLPVLFYISVKNITQMAINLYNLLTSKNSLLHNESCSGMVYMKR
jgi:hypothetical protein